MSKPASEILREEAEKLGGALYFIELLLSHPVAASQFDSITQSRDKDRQRAQEFLDECRKDR